MINEGNALELDNDVVLQIHKTDKESYFDTDWHDLFLFKKDPIRILQQESDNNFVDNSQSIEREHDMEPNIFHDLVHLENQKHFVYNDQLDETSEKENCCFLNEILTNI